jgi:chemotaxis protein CheY-P-specific phosphatase CheC
VFREVLERQAFMFADPAEHGSLASAGQGFLAASIGFRGEADGRVTLALPKPLADEIACNFLGVDADDPMVAERSKDCFMELLNVTCGHILTALRGEEPIFDLSIPEAADVTAETAAAWANQAGSLLFTVEEKPVLLIFRFGSDSREAGIPGPG